jgi:hypothetical protein
MAKKPAIEHSYNRKKDRFDVRLKRFSLKKKRLRSGLLDNLLAELHEGAKGRKRKHLRDPIKQTKIPEVGD